MSPPTQPPADRGALLRARLVEVRARLDAACAAAGRPAGSVQLLAVSKGHPLDDVDQVAAGGQRAFGESREQECSAKAAARPDLDWHFVGRLQLNKAARVARSCCVVHSCDRPELAAALSRHAAQRVEPLQVLVQVSLDGDPGRGGASPADVASLADLVAASPGLRLGGLMAVAPLGQPPRPAFARLAVLAEALRREHPAATAVSAGMTADLEDAVAEGSTIVRVGTALFGARAPQLG